MATPCGYQQITSLSGSTALTVPTAATGSGAASGASTQKPTRCIIIPETQAIRWRDDGTAPTASVGYPLAVGSELKYDGDLAAIRVIEQVASAKINVIYFYP